MVQIGSAAYGDATNFNSTWNISLTSTGSTNNTSIELPLESGGTYDFTVWWGDDTNDTITAYNQTNVTHNYSAQGEYNVVIDGTIQGFRFNNDGDRLKLLNITNWGNLRLGNSNGYFYGCSNLNVGATDTLDLTGTTTFYYAFNDCSGLTTLNVSTWNTSSVTTFAYAFRDCSGLTTLNVSTWNTSSVTTFAYAFHGCSKLTALDVSAWNTSSVTSFYWGFYGCSGLTTLNVSTWNTSSVTTFYFAFSGCSGLTTLNVSAWDTSSVTTFAYAFRDCSGLTTLNVSTWNTSSVTSFYWGFYGCSGLTTLNVSTWDTSSVTTFYYTFYGCSGLTTLTGIGDWNVSACTVFTNFLYGVTLTTINYDSLLNGWVTLPTLSPSEAFHGGNSKYSLVGEYSRNNTLIGTHLWTITDGGLDIENAVTSLHYNSTEDYFHRIETDGTLSVNRSVIIADATNWTANSTTTNATYHTYWVFTTKVNATGYTNFTISGENLDNFTVSGLSASTSYSVSNASEVGTFTTDGAGNATFETDLIVDDYTVVQSAVEAPNITSYAPETPNSTYENVAATFNATINQSNANNEWLINGTWQEDNNNTGSPEYTNSTWTNGTYNLTLISHNSSNNALTDSQTWIVTVLLNSVDTEVTYWNPDSGGLVATINITNITAGVQTINFLLNDTNANYQYNVTYSNGTYVDSATATYENESLNFSIPLVEDSYNITETALSSSLTIPANTLAMFNNWTTATTFSAIAANESNDKAYYFYNATSGEWESYDPGYSWNANNVIGKDNSVIGFFNAETTITSQIITPSSTELHEGWNMLAVQSSSNQTITDIKSNIGANCTDIWKFNSTAGDYSNITTDSLQPNEGLLAYINTAFTWTRSDL